MKLRNGLIRFFFIMSFAFIFACSPGKEKAKSKSISIFAASATTLPVSEICDTYSEIKKIAIERNFASSGTLARQIYNGAEADLYISANKQWVDFLKEKQLLADSSIEVLASNKLVVICPEQNVHLDIEFLNDFDITSSVKNKIVIGDPEYVPAGKYAKQALDNLAWFERLKENTIMAKDVVSVLHYVELGECDWGIVYYSEAVKSDKVRIAYEIPAELYPPIVFYISMLKEATSSSNDLYEIFLKKEAQAIFERHGFTVNI